MSGRDWYAEWLLGEAWRTLEIGSAVVVPTPGCADDLAILYTDLTGHEPPPRPTEEEVQRALDAMMVSAPMLANGLRLLASSANPQARMMARAVVEMGRAK